MLDYVLSYFLVYSYPLLALVVFFASFGIPIPATALVLAAGAFASQGYVDAEFVLLTVMSASIAGDNALLHATRSSGISVLNTLRLSSLLDTEIYRYLEKKIESNLVSTLFLSRWLFVSIGPAVTILCGLTNVSRKRFFVWSVLGETLYALIFVSIGFIFGTQWDVIYSLIQDIIGILLLCLILVIVIQLTRVRIQRHKKRKRQSY